ncbi:MAG: anthranilate synthase component I family protein [Phycisphaerae bacterium]|nr:anthranilate synthase component I family protein [Phycisphaerae bacterium]
MIRPSLDEAKTLAAGCTVVPIALEIFSDQTTPIEILRNIRRQSECCYILESINGSDSWGRYSFVGYKPVMAVWGTGNVVARRVGIEETEAEEDALAVIRELIAKHKSPRIADFPPFTGGFVGYFAYDFVRKFIPGLELHAKNHAGFRDFHLMLMDKVIAFDHFKQKIYIIVNIPTENIEQSYIRGVTELKDIEKTILTPAAHGEEESLVRGEFTQAFTEERFKEMVGTVKRHIVEGDIFQAVISNRFKAHFKGSLMNTYRILRTLNPSPYMVYMNLDNMEIACSSPETLVALRDGEVSSFPLAGTCPRGKTPEEDKALCEALLMDEKELAEHDMLVDLARNDIGKVCRFGSVQVREYRQIKRFSHVSHISSHVTGTLREGRDAMDVIAAALPAGTLSGAPKKRACEIIDAVEGIKRGVYGGAIGYIDFAGNMDMCIGIRMAVLKDGNVFVQSGAGIVADSVPENEYRETQNKARAVMEALRRSGEVRT